MFQIPNAADAFNPNQAEPDKVDFDILSAGIAGDGVVSGCGVSAISGAGLDVLVAAGEISVSGIKYQVDGGTLILDPAETNPRFDLIVGFNNTGVGAQVVQGLSAAEPVFPEIPAGSVALAAVFVPADALEIDDSHIVDKRCFVPDPDGDAPAFPSGTKMLFVQTSAPVGWTKDTTHNNKALRLVTGSVSSGGSQPFTTAFASKTPAGSVSVSGTVGSTTLSTAQMPVHSHAQDGNTILATDNGQSPGGGASTSRGGNTGNAGSGSSHNHSFSGSGSFSGSAIDLAVQYVDAIIATKD